MDQRSTLAENLRVLRAKQNLNIKDAASKIGITRETLRDLENGTRDPYPPTLARIAAGYNISVRDLLSPAEELITEGKAEASSESTSPKETTGAGPNVEPSQETSLLDDPQIVEWLREHDLTWGTTEDEAFKEHVRGLDLDELDGDGMPVAVMALGRALANEQVAALDLLWVRSKYRSLGGLLSVNPNAPVAEQKNQRHDQLSKLRMQLDRRYRRRTYVLRRYAELLAEELLAAQKKSATVSSIDIQPRHIEIATTPDELLDHVLGEAA